VPSGPFGKKKHTEQVAQVEQLNATRHAEWQQAMAWREHEHRLTLGTHAEVERERVARLEQARRTYAAECEARDRDTVEMNGQLEALISGLAYGVDSAVQEYVTIVLSNSVYPDEFPVTFEHTFDAASRELTLQASIPPPGDVPSIKAYRYSKSSDEITSTALSAKEQKTRYSTAVLHVALRTLHEVFEADRAGHIHTIAATVGTKAQNPATGRLEFIALAKLAADRATFTGFNLANVVPAATLQHLGGVISKNPLELVPIDGGHGVRSHS
jgi:restriction system protein